MRSDFSRPLAGSSCVVAAELFKSSSLVFFQARADQPGPGWQKKRSDCKIIIRAMAQQLRG